MLVEILYIVAQMKFFDIAEIGALHSNALGAKGETVFSAEVAMRPSLEIH